MIENITHPDFNLNEMLKWRYAFQGGLDFIKRYLYKLSVRETDDDYLIRKDNAYNPAYAKAAINDIKNAIYQRMSDIKRNGGPKTYQDAVKTAVDLELNDMNTFIGLNLIIELLIMRKVGVMTDMPNDLGTTLAERGDKRPYLCVYTAENIRSWTYKVCGNERIFTSLLLCETKTIEDQYGLSIGTEEQYRLMQQTTGGVQVTLFNKYIDQQSKISSYKPNTTYNLNLPRIPFTLFEIPTSLMTDVADYQVALLNLESSDIAFAKKANFPLYYEFYDPKAAQDYKKPMGPPGSDGKASTQNKAKDQETAVGLSKGRRFPIGTNAPGYISPNPDTLRVSMEKGKQLRDDIYRLVNLTVSNLNSSAESKLQDQGTLESGLSFIGFVLQKGENDIARHWAAFENAKPAEVVYPTNYSIETDETRQLKADHFDKMGSRIPSDTYRRHCAKQVVKITLGGRVTDEDLTKIVSEIDSAATLTCDPDQIIADHTAGLVDDETASVARGYPTGTIEKARKDRAERIKLTLEAQGGPQGAGAARGAPEFGGAGGAAEKMGKEKRGTADKVIKGGNNG